MDERLEKRCSKCGIVKPVEQFSKQRQPNGQEGRRSHCKECIGSWSKSYAPVSRQHRQQNREKVNARERERRERDPERYREIHDRSARKATLKAKYNLTEEEYQRMHQAQNGLCAICGKPEVTGRRLSIDHDHTSRAVRALLCQRCNVGIGCFQDDISCLESAVTYLRNFEVLHQQSNPAFNLVALAL